MPHYRRGYRLVKWSPYASKSAEQHQTMRQVAGFERWRVEGLETALESFCILLSGWCYCLFVTDVVASSPVLVHHVHSAVAAVFNHGGNCSRVLASSS